MEVEGLAVATAGREEAVGLIMAASKPAGDQPMPILSIGAASEPVGEQPTAALSFRDRGMAEARASAAAKLAVTRLKAVSDARKALVGQQV